MTRQSAPSPRPGLDRRHEAQLVHPSRYRRDDLHELLGAAGIRSAPTGGGTRRLWLSDWSTRSPRAQAVPPAA
jgi:hypothetical protein